MKLSPQIKEEEEELCSSQEREQLGLKEETDTFMVTVAEEGEHSEPDMEKQFCCPTCGKSFNRRSNLLSHTKIHTSEKPYSCETCGKSFNRGSNLLRHMRSHTGEKPYVCKSCGTRFSEFSSLKRHKAHFEDGCSEAGPNNVLLSPLSPPDTENGKKYYRIYTMKYLERIQTVDKRYCCKICGKGFAHRCNLVDHMRIHTGEKPYTCETCGKSFNRVGNFNAHMRNHTGKKPYACETCGKGFNHRCNLVDHVRIHTGEKPYTCETCGKSFNRISSLSSLNMKYCWKFQVINVFLPVHCWFCCAGSRSIV
uniref:C2H2-type domain-containing protein n=1 Tax=Maylandia zebra TaxID=106582 RepID=A0A3P9CAK7_9CICH